MSAEELIRKDRLRPVVSGFGKGRYWQYRDIKGHYTVVPTKEEAIKRANEALLATEAGVPHEPVKGEQAGMLGVPGKYVEQKRPWTPGQIEIETYQKYKEAMGKPEVEVHTAGEFGITGRGILDESKAVILRDGTVAVDMPTGWGFYTQGGKHILLEKITSRQIDEATALFTELEAIPKAEAKVEAEAMESPEELDRKLREFERKTLKEEQAKEAKELEKILSGMMGKKKKPKVEIEAMKQAEKPGKNLYWYSIAELRKMCQNKGLSTEGSKESLIRRLHNA